MEEGPSLETLFWCSNYKTKEDVISGSSRLSESPTKTFYCSLTITNPFF